jgi:hypothetical protein
MTPGHWLMPILLLAIHLLLPLSGQSQDDQECHFDLQIVFKDHPGEGGFFDLSRKETLDSLAAWKDRDIEEITYQSDTATRVPEAILQLKLTGQVYLDLYSLDQQGLDRLLTADLRVLDLVLQCH